MTILTVLAYRAMTCHNGVHACLGGCACVCLCVTGGGWLHISQGLDESLKNSSSIPLSQSHPPPTPQCIYPAKLLQPSHPEDSLKARRPELDEETPQWRRLGCVGKEDKKKGSKKTHSTKAPFHVFVCTNKWWIVPQAKVFLLELKSRGKSTWQSGRMECER